jgi:hypothetical protein
MSLHLTTPRSACRVTSWIRRPKNLILVEKSSDVTVRRGQPPPQNGTDPDHLACTPLHKTIMKMRLHDMDNAQLPPSCNSQQFVLHRARGCLRAALYRDRRSGLLLLEGRTAHASMRLCMIPQRRITPVRLLCPVASFVRPNTRGEPSPAAALPFGLHGSDRQSHQALQCLKHRLQICRAAASGR